MFTEVIRGVLPIYNCYFKLSRFLVSDLIFTGFHSDDLLSDRVLARLSLLAYLGLRFFTIKS